MKISPLTESAENSNLQFWFLKGFQISAGLRCSPPVLLTSQATLDFEHEKLIYFQHTYMQSFYRKESAKGWTQTTSSTTKTNPKQTYKQPQKNPKTQSVFFGLYHDRGTLSSGHEQLESSAYLKVPQHVEVVLPPAGCPATQSQCEHNLISSPQVCCYERVLPQSKAHTIGVYIWSDFKIWMTPESAGAATHAADNETQMCQSEMGHTKIPALCFQERSILHNQNTQTTLV